ncbi:NAD-dependent epimerase/dehydratase family protein [Urechidicola vernalis]|uniref:NAD-dependent epimerase/dehydratase family protein n=1 Tax=Urechidicola vernalis TaxID=3075600 RepID=A0ABU2Y1K0_9FLAO|nr:NAD-dependent epimerase/dehydratase family protein [Urechidicola sp. P050]MDT0551892.1 NAD-dependent epimerase/dehydratase family protein [Urechidicola sp. P050]
MGESLKIGLTGATGHLGNNVLLHLIELGYTVKSLYRSSLNVTQHPNLTWIKGDLKNEDSLELLIENTSVVIHCAGVISIGNIASEKVLDINVNGTKNIIEKCLKHNVKLIYISSTNAVAESSENEVFNEERPYKTNADFVYGHSKALAEEAVVTAIKKEGLDAIILRPSAIVGPPDHIPSHFGNAILDFANGKFPFLTSGGYNVVDVRDVTRTIINSITLGKSGEIYLVTGAYMSIFDIAQLANPTKKFKRISLDLLIVLLPIIALIKRAFKFDWPISKESLITLNYGPKVMDNSKAVRLLKHEIRPTQETINDLINWFKTTNKL